MKSRHGSGGNIIATILIFLASLLLFFLLYYLRSFDDSRLSSWHDVFGVIRPARVFFLIIAFQGIAFMVFRLAHFERYPAVFLFLLSCGASVFFLDEPEVIVDASRYFTQAKHLAMYGIPYFVREWGTGISAWTDLPAVPLLYGTVFSIFGESRVAVQACNTLMFSFVSVLTFLEGKELWDKETGLSAGIFLLGIPYIFTQVPLMLVDVPAMFFFMLSVYAFTLALKRGGIMVPAASLSIFVSFFTKYSTWLMLTVIPVIFSVLLYRNRRQNPGQYALRGLIVFSLSCFLISVTASLMHDVMITQIHLLLSYQKPGLIRWGESLLSTWFFQVHPALTVLSLFSIYSAFKKKDVSYVIIAWLVVVVLVLQVRRIRYLVMIFPMVSLMASYGLMHIRDRSTVRFLPMSVSAFSLCIALFAFLPFQRSTSPVNLRDAGRYLDAIPGKDVLVYTLRPAEYILNPAVSVPLLDLYTRKEIRYHYVPKNYPAPEDLATSSLRFTWAYANPPYYERKRVENEVPAAVVVISDRAPESLPPEILERVTSAKQRARFGITDRVYRHQATVTIYHR